MEFIELILINKLDGVILKYPHHENVDGTVCITGHHLILSSRKEGVRELWLLHKNIDSIEKKENKPSGGVTQGGSLFLKCKDLRIFQLDIATTTELNLMAQTLESLSNLQDPRLFYPFFYRHMHPIVENGYTLYSIEGEFTKVLASEEWRVSRVNHKYTVCSSYGKAVVVPKTIDDSTLTIAASFRQGGRFPVLSYRHNNGAVLMRAGQPLYGPKHRRCRADEAILNTIVAVGTKGVIYDLRSSNSISQQQNKGGGGTESSSNYSQWKIYNRSMDDVDNQHQLLDSYSKLIEACNDKDISSDKWLSKLESCGWPESVRNSLHTACIVAQHIHQKVEPVLVHGTRGEDATLLVCSLVQIILNPDCRTIRGLQALIEREWLQAGHPFGSRLRCGPYAASQPRAAPTFLLFLDCIRQFLEQFPCSFEYRQSYLITLFEHSYASQFGTFLCDNEQERESRGVYSQTTSTWSWLNQPRELPAHISPLYDPTPGVIWPSVAPMSYVIWEELYLRWLVEQNTEQREEQYKVIRSREQQLRSQAQQLRRELFDIASQYYNDGKNESKEAAK
ncbi:myotubularin-related protein 9 isoform X1 [Plodia interpunctella]|uniref:myotubularin-related protein 9 isoform X1 n=1 Tax=Plodia interpunctella TaxID=58824 RepID=UPI002368D19D|nr:myotubularin-related protein 9 isoform X1 [Plodia interpunctella]